MRVNGGKQRASLNRWHTLFIADFAHKKSTHLREHVPEQMCQTHLLIFPASVCLLLLTILRSAILLAIDAG